MRVKNEQCLFLTVYEEISETNDKRVGTELQISIYQLENAF